MSAREEIMKMVAGQRLGGFQAGVLLDAYRTEVRTAALREAAATLRSAYSEVYDDAGQRTAEGLSRAADLIDPGVRQHLAPCRFPLSPDCTCGPSTEGGAS